MSVPKTRSDGAYSTGAAITSVMIVVSAETATRSATRPRNIDHRGEDESRTGDGPSADVAHVRRQVRVAGEGVERDQAGRLRQTENREPGEETLPADGD